MMTTTIPVMPWHIYAEVCRVHKATTNSNMVLVSVSFSPPNWTKSRTFALRFALAV